VTNQKHGMVRLFINVGKKQRIKPGDILGAIAGETGMPGHLVGSIDMYDSYTFVDVPKEYAQDVIDTMKRTSIKGKSIHVERAKH
ncbi:MAG: ATP-dependent helicase DeaD, partial [Clostridiales bacterium]|nr:ATP-dependent helicase DeaD [Clostridiales bacterium]